MKQDDMITKRHLADLYRQADRGGYYVYSDFLSPADQALLSEAKREGLVGDYSLCGGYDSAERRMAVFGSESEFGYAYELPAGWLKIAPVAKKFAEELSHRDFLGSLMGLGITRDLLGDILIVDGEAFLFASESIHTYLLENLTEVKHTKVACAVVDTPPAAAVALPDEAVFVVAGERLDAFVAGVYKLSRSESAALIEKGLVAIDGKVTEKILVTPREGAMISVRGYGRFLYVGICGDTRKGKIRITARVY